MNSFVIAAFCAVLACANGGLIGSGLVSPLGVRTIATGLAPSTVVAGPSGTIIDSRNIAVGAPVVAAPALASRTLIDNVGLISGAGIIAAPGVISGGAIIDNGLALRSGLGLPLSTGILANNGLLAPGLVAPGVIAARNGLLW